jgi:hypothetical protein
MRIDTHAQFVALGYPLVDISRWWEVPTRATKTRTTHLLVGPVEIYVSITTKNKGDQNELEQSDARDPQGPV